AQARHRPRGVDDRLDAPCFEDTPPPAVRGFWRHGISQKGSGLARRPGRPRAALHLTTSACFGARPALHSSTAAFDRPRTRAETTPMPPRRPCLAPALLLALAAPPAPAADARPLEFHLTFDRALCARPFTGRVYVLLSRTESKQLPGGPNWFKPEPFF